MYNLIGVMGGNGMFVWNHLSSGVQPTRCTKRAIEINLAIKFEHVWLVRKRRTTDAQFYCFTSHMIHQRHTVRNRKRKRNRIRKVIVS